MPMIWTPSAVAIVAASAPSLTALRELDHFHSLDTVGLAIVLHHDCFCKLTIPLLSISICSSPPTQNLSDPGAEPGNVTSIINPKSHCFRVEHLL